MARSRQASAGVVALCVMLALIALCLSAAAGAGTLTVSNTHEEGPGSLRQAIADASAGETIVVPAGDYPVISEELEITKSLTIQGAGARTTILDGSGMQRVLHVHSPATLSLSGVSVSNGKQTAAGISAEGGGILVDENATLILDRTAVSDNTVDANTTTGTGKIANGGGIYASGPHSTLTIANSTLSGNTVLADSTEGLAGNAAGGAIYVNKGTLTLTNSTIEGNRASASSFAPENGGTVSGAGLYEEGTATLLNDTLADNTAVASGAPAGLAEGGDIYADGGVSNPETLQSTIVTGGVADAGSENCAGGSVSSLGHNVESANTCNLTGPGDQSNTDPKLSPLADNGGPTDTDAITASSPALDAGDPASCPSTDQRGIPRPQGAACDVGAFEFLGPAAAITGSASAITPTSVTLAGSADAGDGTGASALFQYGASPSYANQTPAQALAAVIGPHALSVSLSGLAPNTIYHFRLIATNALGTVAGTDQTFATPPLPTLLPARDRISMFKISPRAFVAASSGGSIASARHRATGAIVSYTGTLPAKTTFTVQRAVGGRVQGRSCVRQTKRNHRRRRCTRYLSLKGFTRSDTAGANRFRFTGRVAGHKLKPGTYRMRAIPRTAAGAGAAVYLSFRINA